MRLHVKNLADKQETEKKKKGSKVGIRQEKSENDVMTEVRSR